MNIHSRNFSRLNCENFFLLSQNGVDIEPPESARKLGHSKTLRVVGSRQNPRQCFGLIRPSAAFPNRRSLMQPR